MPKKDLEQAMLTAVQAYLETQGYYAAVISADRVQVPLGAGPHCNYEFVVRFTGVALAQAASIQSLAAPSPGLSKKKGKGI